MSCLSHSGCAWDSEGNCQTVPKAARWAHPHQHVSAFLSLPPLQAALAEPAHLAFHMADAEGIPKGLGPPWVTGVSEGQVCVNASDHSWVCPATVPPGGLCPSSWLPLPDEAAHPLSAFQPNRWKTHLCLSLDLFVCWQNQVFSMITGHVTLLFYE